MSQRTLVGVALSSIVTCALAVPRAGAQTPEPPIASPQQIACAPGLAWGEPAQPIRIVGSQRGLGDRMFGPTDSLALSAGADQSVAVGQQYFVRRLLVPYESRGRSGSFPMVRHTAGWIRIVAVDQTAAVATIVHACGDGMLLDDFIEPFQLPEAPTLRAPGQPDYANPATVLFGDQASTQAGIAQYLVISRGAKDNVAPGQRVAFFRESFGRNGPVTNIGEGAVVAVNQDSSTARVLTQRDAIYAGDLAALHR